MGIRVLIVDNHALVRRGIEAVLRQAPDMEVVGYASSYSEAVEKACELRPGVIVIDIHMPDRHGLDIIRTIRERCPDTNMLVLTQEADPEEAIKALEAGAAGFVFKDIAPEHLQAAVRHLASGRAMLNPTVARHILNRIAATSSDGMQAGRGVQTKGLSDREIEIVICLSSGMIDREIAAKLFLSEATVKTHLKAIYRKLGVRNRAQAAAVATFSGLVPQVPH
jgi:DNA-binding NarL/FixJ family response regulator